MKLNFRIIGKVSLLLVIIGFFMPIACDQNGFQIADYMVNNNSVFEGILMYILFISAVAGVILGALQLVKKPVSVTADWVVIIVCIASGLIVYFSKMKDIDLQNGAYVILVGWIAALALQIMSKLKNE